jgi:hypothetical protein
MANSSIRQKHFLIIYEVDYFSAEREELLSVVTLDGDASGIHAVDRFWKERRRWHVADLKSVNVLNVMECSPVAIQ